MGSNDSTESRDIFGNLETKEFHPLFGNLNESHQPVNANSTQHSREAVKIIASPKFLNGYDELKVLDTKHLKVGAVVRNKEDRKLLHGYDCKCCASYYNGLGLNTQQRVNRIDQVSRHRALEMQPPTPEHYWEVGMADRAEQQRRGQIMESDSPFALNTRHAHYKHVVN
ncbi:unnamed protein product, partial [Anisakis simplex]|uniref:SAE2 domain-containing protein n=1 Tax=Anisakis simplex TaxID=6269 RepID=A0A0M3KE91_ANISI